MRKYTLASKSAKGYVDLRDYEDVITAAVLAVMPNATVKVEEKCYYVSPTPKQGEAIKIGRQICQSELSRYCVQIPKLFTSIELEEANHGAKQHSKPLGGHR